MRFLASPCGVRNAPTKELAYCRAGACPPPSVGRHGTGGDKPLPYDSGACSSAQGPLPRGWETYLGSKYGPTWALAFLLVILAISTYLPTLSNGFVWDDESYIVNNPRVAGGLSRQNIAWAFTAVYEANWHPLTWLSHQLDARLFDLRPAGHHLVNLLFHAGNALLLFALLLRLTGARWASFLVAALFTVHPAHVESVAWVAERKDVLSAFLALLAAMNYVAYVRGGPKTARLLLAGVLFAAALLAKPMPVTLPFLFLLFDFWPLGRLRRGAWARPLLEKTPLFLLAAASSAATLWAQTGGAAVNTSYPARARIANALVAAWAYLGKTLWPARLSVYYPHPGAIPAWKAGGALLALGGLTALALAFRRRRPWLPMGWFWFLGMLIPMIGIVQVGSQGMADRYLYLPQLGLSVTMVFGACAALAGGRPALRAAAVAVAALLIALALAGNLQAHYWRDNGTLFEHALLASEGNYVAHEQLGVWYQSRGETARAVEHYRAVLALQPFDGVTHNNLGKILSDGGQDRESIAYFRNAVGYDPTLVKAYFNLARAYTRVGEGREAVAWYRRGLAVSPGDPDAHLNLGALLAEQGDLAGAVWHFAESARLDPTSADARSNLGVVLAARGEYANAVEQFREAIRLKPEDRSLRESLAKVEALARR